jgi:hypothetical protein
MVFQLVFADARVKLVIVIPRIFMQSLYGIPMIVLVVFHLPRARAPDFLDVYYSSGGLLVAL